MNLTASTQLAVRLVLICSIGQLRNPSNRIADLSQLRCLGLTLVLRRVFAVCNRTIIGAGRRGSVRRRGRQHIPKPW